MAAVEGPQPEAQAVVASAVDESGAETHGVSRRSRGRDEMGPPLPESVSDMVARKEEAAEEDIDQMMALQPERMARLVRVYEKMRPKQVALILGTMPERQASSILQDMKDQSAAKVLAEMEPGKAARMSQLLIRTAGNEL